MSTSALQAAGSVGKPAGGRVGGRALPHTTAGLPLRRRLAGLALLVAGLPLLTAALVAARPALTLPSDLLIYLLAVVLIAATGGVLLSVLAAVTASLLANYWLTPPYHTLTIAADDHVVALAVFLVVAVTVSLTVEVAARRRVQAVRSRAEAATLSELAAVPLGEDSLPALLDRVRATFGMSAVALLRPDAGGWVPILAVGADRDWSDGRGPITAAVTDRVRLVGAGREVFAEDRRLLAAYAATIARSLTAWELAEEAARARELAAVDRLRAALLAAVGHDLRTPLAGIKAAVSSLRQHDVRWTEQESDELLATVEESADRLDDLVANLLDMSRLQAGALSADVRPVALDEVVPAALLFIPPDRVEVAASDSLPLVLADPGLLERVVSNLLANALRFSPPDRPVQVAASVGPGVVRLAVVDHGPGVAPGDRDRIFAPFQRLDDRSAGGVGLGLAIARGFTTAMGGTLVPSDTPGGGLTMTVSLPRAG